MIAVVRVADEVAVLPAASPAVSDHTIEVFPRAALYQDGEVAFSDCSTVLSVTFQPTRTGTQPPALTPPVRTVMPTGVVKTGAVVSPTTGYDGEVAVVPSMLRARSWTLCAPAARVTFADV